MHINLKFEKYTNTNQTIKNPIKEKFAMMVLFEFAMSNKFGKFVLNFTENA